MKEITLIGEKEVIVNEGKMLIGYYLIRESSICKASDLKSIYGIKIEKEFEGVTESEEVKGISYSKEVVLQLIQTLMNFTVTPMTMVEVLDDLITERLCS